MKRFLILSLFLTPPAFSSEKFLEAIEENRLDMGYSPAESDSSISEQFAIPPCDYVHVSEDTSHQNTQVS